MDAFWPDVGDEAWPARKETYDSESHDLVESSSSMLEIAATDT